MARYFHIDEFRCKHCNKLIVDDSFLARLDEARHRAGRPFIVTSGYRCPEHNAAVGGVPDSAHTKGQAADIRAANSADRFAIVEGALRAGFVRVGVGKDFVHLDTDGTKPRAVMWLY